MRAAESPIGGGTTRRGALEDSTDGIECEAENEEDVIAGGSNAVCTLLVIAMLRSLKQSEREGDR